MRKLYIFGLVGLLAVIIGLAWADQLTISTYYPAPYGVYRDFKVTRDARFSTEQDGSGNYIGKVGIGVLNPEGTLDVRGGLAIRDPKVGYDDRGDAGSRAGIIFGANTNVIMPPQSDAMFWIAPGGVSGDPPTPHPNRFHLGIGNDYADETKFVKDSNNDDVVGGPIITADHRGNVGIANPNPTFDVSAGNNFACGNLDVNDVYLRSTEQLDVIGEPISGTGSWASQGVRIIGHKIETSSITPSAGQTILRLNNLPILNNETLFIVWNFTAATTSQNGGVIASLFIDGNVKAKIRTSAGGSFARNGTGIFSTQLNSGSHTFEIKIDYWGGASFTFAQENEPYSLTVFGFR